MPETVGEIVMEWYEQVCDELAKIGAYYDRGWRPMNGAAILLAVRDKSGDYRRLTLERCIRRDLFTHYLKLIPVFPLDARVLSEKTQEELAPLSTTLMMFHEYCYPELYHTEFVTVES